MFYNQTDWFFLQTLLHSYLRFSTLVGRRKKTCAANRNHKHLFEGYDAHQQNQYLITGTSSGCEILCGKI